MDALIYPSFFVSSVCDVVPTYIHDIHNPPPAFLTDAAAPLFIFHLSLSLFNKQILSMFNVKELSPAPPHFFTNKI